ncbi:alpha/beta hydrolase [Lysinibacillus yapensis]|uniref:Alpha/beta hydrolase n=1 Tax=Ureibacillus yapensis TaxID=2304605 RepID=A0A396SAN1_9BACL|nr:alpha/beta hydrolase [Lysinibacillus yapensis]RHW32046.1 alpha/beta hydrolase [Lysinibacillus yapensis]
MKTTVVYKKGEQFEIKADFYSAPVQSAPVLVYIHGGGLLWGSREDLKAEQVEFYLQSGFNVFSIDYRLAPETKLPDIKTDIADALSWLKVEGTAQFDYNPEKIAVIGGSAGGYLALLSGTLDTKPQAIVSFYGYGDITGDWARKPSPHYQKMTPVPKELADMLVSKDVITVGPIQKRYAIYMHARQTGVWIDKISGMDTKELSALCPLHLVNSDYPPALLLHGTNDEDVPYEQSVIMSEALTDAGVENQLITIPNGKHVFDEDWENEVVKDAFKDVVQFLRKHLS